MDRLDFLRRVVHVDRQLVTVTGRPSFLTAPKTAASVRAIPLPQVVLDALAAHTFGAFTLGDGFVFVTAAGNPIRRTAFGDGGLPPRPRARRLGRAFISCGISMPAR